MAVGTLFNLLMLATIAVLVVLAVAFLVARRNRRREGRGFEVQRISETARGE